MLSNSVREVLHANGNVLPKTKFRTTTHVLEKKYLLSHLKSHN